MLCSVAAAVLVCGLLAGCATKGELDQMRTDVKADVAKMRTEINADVAKVGERVAAVQTRLDAAIAKLNSLEQQLSATNAQVAANRKDITGLQGQLRNLVDAIHEGQRLLLKSLEDARDIYKRQFMALDKIIEDVKARTPAAAETKQPGVEEKKPAPEGK